MSVAENLLTLRSELPEGVELVAVSKTFPPGVVMSAYQAGQRIFGENRPQELVSKYNELPKDIVWHMIGHLQTNKVKYIAPFVSLIHSADSGKLLEVINKEAMKNDRVIDVLLEIRIAREETKHGWDETELTAYLEEGSYRELAGVRFRGVMGIATYTDDNELIKSEFSRLMSIYDSLRNRYFGKDFDLRSFGMSSDWRLAVECGSNMVRIGSGIFGVR